HWVERADYWQEQTRAIEDKLSDALHEALIKRFVDRRASVLMKSLEEGKQLLAGIRVNGEVIVESHLIGHLHTFRFIPIEGAAGADYKAVMNAARNALNTEVKRRLNMILTAKPEQFTLKETGEILWQQKFGSPLPGEPVARLKKSDHPLKPDMELIDCDLLEGTDKEQVSSHLKNWLNEHIKVVLEPLVNLEDQKYIQGAARGIAYQVYENMGIVPREKLEDLIKDLTTEDRAALRASKIKMGPILVFLPALNKPAAVRLRALLWALFRERTLPVEVPNDGIVSVKIDKKSVDRHFYQSIGYPVFGSRAIRIDMLDRVISAVYDSAEKGKFQAQHKMAEWLGCPIEDLYDVLQAMGHKKVYDPAAEKAGENSDEIEQEVKQEIKATEENSLEKAAKPEKSGQEETADKKTEADNAQDESATEEASEKEPKKPQEPDKPELATFRLKKGKAFEKPAHFKKPFNKDHKSKAKSGKKAARGNPKGKEYKKSMMSAEAKTKDDSPFAILEQLKKNADG
ncbi:MAG: helicase, partial [Alphaproteobacteria bacterium]